MFNFCMFNSHSDNDDVQVENDDVQFKLFLNEDTDDFHDKLITFINRLALTICAENITHDMTLGTPPLMIRSTDKRVANIKDASSLMSFITGESLLRTLQSKYVDSIQPITVEEATKSLSEFNEMYKTMSLDEIENKAKGDFCLNSQTGNYN